MSAIGSTASRVRIVHLLKMCSVFTMAAFVLFGQLSDFGVHRLSCLRNPRHCQRLGNEPALTRAVVEPLS